MNASGPHFERATIVGGGSAGFLSALTFKRAFPELDVTLIHSPTIPVIGVGESTTRAVPLFLHQTLGLERGEFYRQVRPIWKLGNRLAWGSADVPHFNYPFDSFLTVKDQRLRKPNLYYCADDMTDAGLFYSLMDQCLSPVFVRPDGQCVVPESYGYHIDNRRFLDYLRGKSAELGVELLEGEVAHVHRAANGAVESLQLADGRRLAADLFVDCSGFGSRLLREAMGQRFVSYGNTLFCDTAVIGSWQRDDEVVPLTTSETMEHGWCWRIEFEDRVTRGYVFSSQFCTPDEAMRELQTKNPKLDDELRVLKFPSGRYENFWVQNVVAIGNSSGFVEPLEATALQLIIEQLRFVCKALLDSDGDVPDAMRDTENARYRQRWDDVRDFLAVHYKFNRHADSAFWRHCRAETALGGAEPLVHYYQQAGPSLLADHWTSERGIFGFDGYLTMLLGQRVETQRPPRLTEPDRADWRAYQANIRWQAAQALPMREALKLMDDPSFPWPSS